MDSSVNSPTRPTGGIAAAILFFFLNLNPHQGKTLKQHLQEFDFLGLIFIVSGVVCLLIGFNESETSCEMRMVQNLYLVKLTLSTGHSAVTISLLVVGCVLLVVGGINECFTSRSPIVPPRLFHTRTTGIILITTFFHAVAFFSGIFFPYLITLIFAEFFPSFFRCLLLTPVLPSNGSFRN